MQYFTNGVKHILHRTVRVQCNCDYTLVQKRPFIKSNFDKSAAVLFNMQKSTETQSGPSNELLYIFVARWTAKQKFLELHF